MTERKTENENGFVFRKHKTFGGWVKFERKGSFRKKERFFFGKSKKNNLSFFQGKVLFGPRKAILTFPLFPIFGIFVKRKVPRCEYIFKEPFLLHLEPFAYE